MENASKALIIAGAILISILIIAIGMYIYSSSTSSIENAISSMNTQEVQAFNATWTNYEGTKTGAQVKSLINQLIGHANTYEEEAAKVIGIYCEATNNNPANATNIVYQAASEQDTTEPEVHDELINYIGALNNLYSAIQAKHNYDVDLEFMGTSIIRKISISYDVD